LLVAKDRKGNTVANYTLKAYTQVFLLEKAKIQATHTSNKQPTIGSRVSLLNKKQATIICW